MRVSPSREFNSYGLPLLFSRGRKCGSYLREYSRKLVPCAPRGEAINTGEEERREPPRVRGRLLRPSLRLSHRRIYNLYLIERICDLSKTSLVPFILGREAIIIRGEKRREDIRA